MARSQIPTESLLKVETQGLSPSDSDESWTTVGAAGAIAYSGTWAAHATEPALRYRIDSLGNVHFVGSCQLAATPHATLETVLVLPANMAPGSGILYYLNVAAEQSPYSQLYTYSVRIVYAGDATSPLALNWWLGGGSISELRFANSWHPV